MEEIPTSILWEEEEEMACRHPWKLPGALLTLPDLSIQMVTTDCLPSEARPAAHVHFFTPFRNQIPLERFTMNLFSS